MPATSTDDYKLFTPLTLGDDLVLRNRVVFGPLTRSRADPTTRAPTAINARYYEQRASAGLIFSEGCFVSEQGFGWYGAPALYNELQADAWKKVTDTVHAKGGKIFVQLWHIGRQGHRSFNAQHDLVSPSAIGLEGGRIRDAHGEHTTTQAPRALEAHEISEIVDDFRKSAELAKKAGFDGVEVLAANGYLLDEFLQSVTNTRTDQYGGSIENRARIVLEVTDAVLTVWPAHRVGVRLSPNGGFAGMGGADNYEQCLYTMEQLSQRKLGYLALLDGEGFPLPHHGKGRLVTAYDAKKAFRGVVIAGNGYTRDTAEGVLRSGAADGVLFGRPFIANPDLVERFRHDWPLAPLPPREVWWDPTLGAEGYTTFPAFAIDAAP